LDIFGTAQFGQVLFVVDNDVADAPIFVESGAADITAFVDNVFGKQAENAAGRAFHADFVFGHGRITFRFCRIFISDIQCRAGPGAQTAVGAEVFVNCRREKTFLVFPHADCFDRAFVCAGATAAAVLTFYPAEDVFLHSLSFLFFQFQVFFPESQS